MNGTLSFSECKFTGGYHKVLGTLKPNHMQKDLFELMVLMPEVFASPLPVII